VPLLLRKIRKNRWYTNNAPGWLREDEIQADTLGDLVTTSNTLSVWVVEDDKSNLDHIIVALASSCDNVSNIDYALFNIDLISESDIKVETKEGLTPYAKANPSHRDLVELTTNKLFKLAKLIFVHSTRERVKEKEVLNLIKNAVNNGQIDPTKLKEGISKKLG